MANPNPPSVVSIGQASGIVVVGISQATVTGTYPVVRYQLLRSFTGSAPWTEVDAESISTVALTTFAYDMSPILGGVAYYAARAVDSQSNLSSISPAVPWSAFSAMNPSSSNISAAALGPYPLLGSDVYIDPASGEGVIGPNGDLLTVNGLECLAQDLRIRLFTEIGELLLQPTFGLTRSKLIGSGQGNPQAQTQYLHVLLTDALLADPRVKYVLRMQIARQNYDAWIVSYDIMAIGQEDALHLNAVMPYWKSS